MSRKVTIILHVTEDELERMYRQEKNSRIKERILAILMIYDGKTVSEIPSLIRRSRRTVHEWLRSWNERGGYDGLVPEFTGGPKPMITSQEWDRVIDEVEEKGMTIRDVTEYVNRTRHVSYSYKTVWEILRTEKRVRYGKPYIRNSKRPEDAEEILKKESMMPYQASRTSTTTMMMPSPL